LPDDRNRPLLRQRAAGISLAPFDLSLRAGGAAAPRCHDQGKVDELTGSRRALAAAGFSLPQDHGAPGTTRETHLLNGGAADSMLVGGDGHRNVSTENPCVRHKFSPDTGTAQADAASLRQPEDARAFLCDDVAPAELIAEADRSERALGSLLCYLAFIAALLLGAGDWLARLFVAMGAG
jgi:hypothetical protein